MGKQIAKFDDFVSVHVGIGASKPYAPLGMGVVPTQVVWLRLLFSTKNKKILSRTSYSGKNGKVRDFSLPREHSNHKMVLVSLHK